MAGTVCKRDVIKAFVSNAFIRGLSLPVVLYSLPDVLNDEECMPLVSRWLLEASCVLVLYSLPVVLCEEDCMPMVSRWLLEASCCVVFFTCCVN